MTKIRQAHDISPGWQERLDKLRETIRKCNHDGLRIRNDFGVLFCDRCGRRLNEDGSER